MREIALLVGVYSVRLCHATIALARLVGLEERLKPVFQLSCDEQGLEKAGCFEARLEEL